MRGAFIVLEGLDRAGKSTQVSLLVQALKDYSISVERRAFPGKMIYYDCQLNIELKNS
jgi:thymidylate kinase